MSSKRRLRRLRERAQEAKNRERLTTWLVYNLPLGDEEPWRREGRERLQDQEDARNAQEFEVAQMAVKRFERRRRLAETLLAKWTARLGRRERALVALDRNAEKIRKS